MWIPVSKDLPGNEDVLVTDGTRVGIANLLDGYIDMVPLQVWEGSPIVPTHWAPLPEPPTIGTDAEYGT